MTRWGAGARAVAGALTPLAILAAPARAAADGPSQTTLEPKSSAAESIADLWWFMLIVSTIVVAIVIALVLLAIMRRRGSRSDRIAGRLGGDWLMAVGGVGVPIVVLAVLFGLVLGTLQDTSPAQSSGGLRIEVTGRQWFWDVRYPDRRMVTANEIHVPVGTPVTILARSEDVIHSFWVPALNRKIDMIPGRTNELSFTADEPGVFRGQCAEFCGLQHANMAFLVSADEPDDFDAWLEAQAKPAAAPSTAQQRRGRSVFISEACSGCHTIAGTQAQGEVGPDLTHLASRSTIAAATLDNDRGDLGGWILDPQHIKPGAKMPGTDLSGPETQAVLDYLQSLK